MDGKACRKCGVLKPLADLVKHRLCPDGRDSLCKECHNKRVATYAHTPEGRATRMAGVHRWQEKNRDYLKDARRKYRQADPESVRRYALTNRHSFKEKARRTLREAVRRGDVVKPWACQNCGKIGERRHLHGHHEDYAKPLDVEWLCTICHGLRERKAYAAERGVSAVPPTEEPNGPNG